MMLNYLPNFANFTKLSKKGPSSEILLLKKRFRTLVIRLMTFLNILGSAEEAITGPSTLTVMTFCCVTNDLAIRYTSACSTETLEEIHGNFRFTGQEEVLSFPFQLKFSR
jgi:hypothetical protein